MTDLDHLFERIAAGEIPSYRVFEDEHVFAFLDINPLSRGHTLVIPRRRCERLEDLPGEVAAALGRALPRIAAAVIGATGAPAYNVLQNNGRAAGQAIPHVHFHIIPKYPDGSGLPHHWPARTLDRDGAPELARTIAERLT
ncbi:MAG: HIT family protein [Phycisphaerales bacterium]|nr:HIT family protein [Phycisphaerales bacterium]